MDVTQSKLKQLNHFIPGPAGLLEAVETAPIHNNTPKGIAIICHPHPLYEGTMNNKVVTTLVKAYNHLGLTAIRFNFRGIGNSQGAYDNAIGEVDDLRAVINWCQKRSPTQSIYLAGFSFGSYIAAKVASQQPVTHLVSVAPPVVNFDFASLPPITCPWIVIQGDQDEVVPPEAVFAWVKTRIPPPQFICLTGASHFFHGKLIELRQRLEEAIVG